MNLKEPFLLVASDAPSPQTRRFGVCLSLGLACIIASFFTFAFSVATFGALYSIGSVLVLASTVFVAGIKQQIENLKEHNRAMCFAVYLATIVSTLFFALYPGIWFRSILVFVSVCIQCIAMAWYCLSYFPRVQSGIRAATMYFFV